MLPTRSTIFWTCFQYISHHHNSLLSCCFTFTVSALSGKTSAPTKVLGTNKLVTTYRADPKDAPAQRQTFMRAMSSHKRLNVLCDNDLLAGFYVVSSTKRIKVLMQPQLCILPDPNTAVEMSYLLGHSSNDANMCRPEYTTADITHNFISLIDTSSIIIPQGFKVGPPFKMEDLANLNLPNIKALMTDTNNYRLVSLPCCIPIPFGAPDTCKGAINEAHLDILSTTLTGGLFWSTCILKWDKTIQDEVITEAVSLGKYLPRLCKGQQWATTAHTTCNVLTDEQEEDTPRTIEKLSTRIELIRDSYNAFTSTPPVDHLSIAIGGNVPSMEAYTIPKKVEEPLNERLRQRSLLAHCGYNRATKSIVLPTHTEAAQWAYYSADKTSINEGIANIFVNIAEELEDAMDFQLREVELPSCDPLVHAQFGHSKFETAPMQSLDLTGETKKSFRWCYLIADSKQLAEERDSSDNDREAEILLGEDTANLSKIKTSIKTSINVLSPHLARVYLANICSILAATFQCDPTLRDSSTPLMYIIARGFAIQLSSTSMRRYFKMSGRSHTELILWVVQMIDQLSLLCTHPLRQLKNLHLMSSGHHSSINIEKLEEAMVMYDDAIDTLKKVATATGTVPSCTLAQNYASKKAKESQAKDAKRQLPSGTTGSTTRPVKKLRESSMPLTSSLEDRDGTLVWSGDGLMPVVDEKDPKLRICAPRHRKGAICPRGAACSFIHETNVDKWPATTFERWAKLVNETDQLAWNPELVSPAQLKTKYVKSPNQVTVASAKK